MGDINKGISYRSSTKRTGHIDPSWEIPTGITEKYFHKWRKNMGLSYSKIVEHHYPEFFSYVEKDYERKKL